MADSFSSYVSMNQPPKKTNLPLYKGKKSDKSLNIFAKKRDKSLIKKSAKNIKKKLFEK